MRGQGPVSPCGRRLHTIRSCRDPGIISLRQLYDGDNTSVSLLNSQHPWGMVCSRRKCSWAPDETLSKSVHVEMPRNRSVQAQLSRHGLILRRKTGNKELKQCSSDLLKDKISYRYIAQKQHAFLRGILFVKPLNYCLMLHIPQISVYIVTHLAI